VDTFIKPFLEKYKDSKDIQVVEVLNKRIKKMDKAKYIHIKITGECTRKPNETMAIEGICAQHS
jgi:hypothetical protein